MTTYLGLMVTVGGFIVALNDRITALEHQIVTDTQFMQLMNKMDQRLTVQETLLRQLINTRPSFQNTPFESCHND